MTEVTWLNPREQVAWRSLVIASNRLRGVLDAELSVEHGLSFADYEVLVQLSEAPAMRLRMSELAERIHLSPSGLTRRLDRLVGDGSVCRERCPSDRRGSFAVLNPHGMQRLIAAAPSHIDGVRRHFLDRLTDEQQLALIDALAGIMQDDPNETSPNQPSMTQASMSQAASSTSR